MKAYTNTRATLKIAATVVVVVAIFRPHKMNRIVMRTLSFTFIYFFFKAHAVIVPFQKYRKSLHVWNKTDTKNLKREKRERGRGSFYGGSMHIII